MKTQPGNVPYVLRYTAIETITPPWGADFVAEVEDGNFLRGGKSLILNGPGAEHAARQWIACLVRGGYNAYRITPLEAIRIMEAKPVPGMDEDRKHEFETAETILVDDFFDDAVMSDEMSYLFIWFFRELLRTGAVVLLASDEKNPMLEVFGPVVGDLIENTFEVIKNGSETTSKAKVKAGTARLKRIRPNGGAVAVVGDTTG